MFVSHEQLLHENEIMNRIKNKNEIQNFFLVQRRKNMTNSTAATAAADQDKTQHALHHLLQNSRHLTNQQYTKATVHPDTLLPLDLKLERPLEQLEQQSRKLWHRLAVLRNTASGGTAMDASAVGDGRA